MFYNNLQVVCFYVHYGKNNFGSEEFFELDQFIHGTLLKTIEEKRILKLNTKETLNAALKAKFATFDEMQKLIDDLELLACDEGRFIGYVRNTQAWGRKGLSPSRKIYK